MKALICKNCGGSINPKTLQCEYCGTQYREELREDSILHIVFQSSPADIKALETRVSVSGDMMRNVPPERIAEFTMKEITHNLSKALAPFVEVVTEYDPRMMVQIVRGRIRVVEPDFRF